MKIAMGLLLVVLLVSCGGRREAEPTVVPVPTFTATVAAIEPTPVPVATEAPTATPEPVQVVESTAVPVLLVATDTPSGPPCDCSGDTLNCGDFDGNEARICFDYCMATVGFDVHRLDADGDGKFCESR